MNQMDHILHNFAHFVEFSKVFTIQQRLHNSTHFAQECTIAHFAKCCTFYTSKEHS